MSVSAEVKNCSVPVKLRSRSGASLVELMVAISISGIVLVGLGSSMSEQLRLSAKSQKQLLAVAIARQMVERVRATPFDKLPSDGLQKEVRVASGDPTDSGVYDSTNKLFDRPLQIDGLNLVWLSPDPSNPMPVSKFGGKVYLTIGPGPSGPYGEVEGTKTANILVTWNEDMPQEYRLRAIICKYGIQSER